MDTRFTEVITSEVQLRTLIGQPSALVANKHIHALDEHCRRFIARSPFLLVASVGADGRLDVSPKGDPPGFVQVLDAHTLAIPERPGNRRADTFCNLMANPAVALIFLVPGKGETLRIGGRACVVRDAWVRAPLAVHGQVPEFVTIVQVEEASFHCTKCMVRSGLWEPARWPDSAGLPSLAEVSVAHARSTQSVQEVQALIDQGLRERLY